MYVSTFMIRKPNSLNEVKEFTEEAIKNNRLEDKCLIIGTIHLNQNEYNKFTKNLLRDYKFLTQYKHNTLFDNECWKCVLVILGNDLTTGLLVSCEGFGYARYTGIYSN